MTREDIRLALEEQKGIVLENKAYLTSTDYISAKIADGAATREEYAEQLSEREGARERIRKAEQRITELEVLTPDPEPLLGEMLK